MISKACKRIIEVDFPVAEVNKHSAREKSIRHGHPSTLHLWWARRPLAACRAVLMGLLLPDPYDENCLEDFKRDARRILATVHRELEPDDEGLRKALLKFIADFANWDLSTNQTYLEAARALVKAAHGEDTPLVVDPFAGGGSIPLEALRLGCDAFASDLNPVACLIEKTLLEDIPRHGPQLADELRRVGAKVKAEAEKELVKYYPADADGSRPIAYLWARTVNCESPNCGAEIPLVRSFWLSKKANRPRALRHKVERPKGKVPFVKFEIFEPKSTRDIPMGTVSQANATCPCCNIALPASRVRAQLAEQHGGADAIFDVTGNRAGGAMLLVVVTLKDGASGRQYRLPNELDYQAVRGAQKAVANLPDGAVPDEPLPSPRGSDTKSATAYFNFIPARLYGLQKWGDLFTARQKLSLVTLTSKVRAVTQSRKTSREAIEAMALVIGRSADYSNAHCSLHSGRDVVRNIFARQAIPMVWDYYETALIGMGSGCFDGALDWVVRVVETIGSANIQAGQVELADACDSPLLNESCAAWFTDPPYYDAIPYADLSDFFFVWLKRSLPNYKNLRDPFDSNNRLTPKSREIIDDLQLLRGVPKKKARELGFEVKDHDFFETQMACAFAEGRRVLREDGVGCVVFAHKTTEGWEALLSGMLRSGLTITASWPITTEMSTRMRARDSAVLAASIHLVCRPRSDDAEVGDWGEIIRALPQRIREWMARLSAEKIRGADLVFSCIGPALELFSQYSRVETPDGEEIGLAANSTARSEPAQRGFLSYIWEVVGRVALEQILGSDAVGGTVGALEEDARLTALFLWTLQATNGNGRSEAKETDEDDEDYENDENGGKKKKGGFALIFDIARRFAQPLGIHLDEWCGRVIEIEKGVVRLIPVRDRAKQLFGEDGAESIASRLAEARASDAQLNLFSEVEERAVRIRGKGQKASKQKDETASAARRQEATTLDRVHAAMLLQASGQSAALRTMLEQETERSPDFLRLANALSALYPRESDEKRLLDGMLLAVPRK